MPAPSEVVAGSGPRVDSRRKIFYEARQRVCLVTKRVCAPRLWGWAVLLLAQASGVLAQAELHVEVPGGSCPNARQVEAALAPVLERNVTLVVEPSGPETRRARVLDRGARYVIEIDGARREVEDPQRDCVERARVASVFIALNMQDARPEPEPATSSTNPPASTGARTTERSRERTQPQAERDPDADEDADEAADEAAQEAAEAAEEAAERAADAAEEAAEASRPLPPDPPPGWGLAAFAIGEHSTDARRTAFGAGAGLFYARAPLHIELDASVLAPIDLALAEREGIRGRVELMRIPLAVLVSYRVRLRDVHLGPFAGLAIDAMHIEGSGVERPARDVRVNLGALAGADLRLAVGPDVGLVLRLQMRFFPKGYRLVVDPVGRFGQTPSTWLGGQLGVELRL